MVKVSERASLNREEARKLGCRYYYTGSVCMNGHSCARLTSTGKCVECRKRLSNNNFKKNAEKVLGRHKSARKKNVKESREIRSRSRRKAKARKLSAQKEARQIEERIRVEVESRMPLSNKSERLVKRDSYVKEQVDRILASEKDIRSYIEELRKITNFSSMCDRKDLEALIAELEKKYPPGLRRVKVCPLCIGRKSVFSRESWYVKHNCRGMKAQQEVVKRLQKEATS